MAQQATLTLGSIPTKGWSCSQAPGINPGTVSVQTYAGAAFPVVANAIIKESTRTITLVDCKLVQCQLVDGSSGNLVRLSYQDRRWRWQFGLIHGSYNQRKTVAGVETLVREETPQQLAIKLLDAMGESGYDVTALPNLSRPEVSWQRVNPAKELQALCDSLGTLITYDYVNDAVILYRIGNGAGVPGGSQSGYIVNKASPASIVRKAGQVRVIGGPAKFQSHFDLGEPLGLETDGKLKKIDDLSYKPAEGWGKAPPNTMGNVIKTYEKDGKTLHTIDLAKASIWKIFRITGRKAGGWVPSALTGGDFQPADVDDITFHSERLTKVEGEDGVERPEPAEVTGEYSKQELGFKDTPPGSVYKGSFTIDDENGLVRFSEAIYSYSDTAKLYAAPKGFVLETSYSCEDKGVVIRHEEFQDSSGGHHGATELLLPHPEIVREIIEGSDGSIKTDNLAKVKEASDHYIQAYIDGLQNITSQDLEYFGIWPTKVDGLARQISWSGGGGGPATTRVSIGQEPNPYVPTYEEVKRQAAAERQLEQVAADDPKPRGSKR